MRFSRDILYHRHRLSHQQIDEFLSESSSKEYLAEKMEQLEMIKEFLCISDSLNQSGVQFIPLKGPVLSYRLYKDPTCRIFKDIDLLVDADSMEKTLEILYYLGYKDAYHRWPGNHIIKKLFLWHRHHFSLWHPEKEVLIELHWKLFYFHSVAGETMTQIIDKNQIHFDFGGRQFNVFNSEFELLFLIIHGGAHDWKRLKWIVDIVQLLKVYPVNEAQFLQLTKTLKAGRLVALCNALLQQYFPESSLLPQENKVSKFLIRFAQTQIDQKEGLDYNSVLGFIKYHRSKMIAFPGLEYKLSVLKQLFFRPIVWIMVNLRRAK